MAWIRRLYAKRMYSCTLRACMQRHSVVLCDSVYPIYTDGVFSSSFLLFGVNDFFFSLTFMDINSITHRCTHQKCVQNAMCKMWMNRLLRRKEYVWQMNGYCRQALRGELYPVQLAFIVRCVCRAMHCNYLCNFWLFVIVIINFWWQNENENANGSWELNGREFHGNR